MYLKMHVVVALLSVSILVRTTYSVVLHATLPLSSEGSDIRAGLQSAFSFANTNYFNTKRSMNLDIFDDAKNATQTIDYVRTIISQMPIFADIFAIGTVYHLLPDIENGKMLIFGPEENSDVYYKENYTHLIHTKAPLSYELEALIDYAINERHQLSFAIFYESNTLGIQGKRLVESILNRHAKNRPELPIRIVANASCPARVLAIDAASSAIVKKYPDAVICIGGRHAVYHFILESVSKGLLSTAFYGTSYVLPIQKPLYVGRGINLVTTALRPDFYNKKIPLVDSFYRDMQQFSASITPSIIAFDAYVHGRIIAEVLRRIDGEVTIQAIIDQAARMDKPYSLEGLTIAFDPKKRTFNKDVWIAPGYKQRYLRVRQATKSKYAHDQQEGVSI